LASPSLAADDPISDFASEFYSYLPAAPDIKAPDFDFIPFWTDDLKKAKRAYKNGDFNRARKFFEKSSEDGNIVADWYLGHMYRLGRGVPRDDAKAFSYFSRVADAFDADETDKNRLRIMVDALVRVGDYYRRGSRAAGVAPDFERAIRIYRLAATYGHPAAQFALGDMQLNGEGLRQNADQGLRWLMTAARKRYAPAEARLGDLYWNGDIVKRDRTRALMWYLLAQSTTRPAEAPEIYDRLDRMLAESSEAERLEAEARATVWADQYPAGEDAIIGPE
jgi:TPR repeat protein